LACCERWRERPSGAPGERAEEQRRDEEGHAQRRTSRTRRKAPSTLSTVSSPRFKLGLPSLSAAVYKNRRRISMMPPTKLVSFEPRAGRRQSEGKGSADALAKTRIISKSPLRNCTSRSGRTSRQRAENSSTPRTVRALSGRRRTSLTTLRSTPLSVSSARPSDVALGEPAHEGSARQRCRSTSRAAGSSRGRKARRTWVVAPAAAEVVHAARARLGERLVGVRKALEGRGRGRVERELAAGEEKRVSRRSRDRSRTRTAAQGSRGPFRGIPC